MSAGVDGGAERRVKRAQTREQGPPSAPAEILVNFTGGSILSPYKIVTATHNYLHTKPGQLHIAIPIKTVTATFCYPPRNIDSYTFLYSYITTKP